MPALPPPARAPEERIALIDALRGSALAGLFLVHCVEHFELSLYPEEAPPLLQRLDAWTHSAAFFLFSGKAYAIFALMFGVSFMLLLQSWTRQGVDVRTRFPWRLLLLGAMGYLNGILYNGDILLVLAILGLPLVLLHRLPDKVLGWLAFLLLLQLPNAWKAVDHHRMVVGALAARRRRRLLLADEPPARGTAALDRRLPRLAPFRRLRSVSAVRRQDFRRHLAELLGARPAQVHRGAREGARHRRLRPATDRPTLSLGTRVGPPQGRPRGARRAALRCSHFKLTLALLKRVAEHLRKKALPQSPLGLACGYLLNHWTSLCAHCDHGQSKLDTDSMENAIRGSAVGNKNYLFVGHPDAGERAAIVYSLVESCRRRSIDPFAYLGLPSNRRLGAQWLELYQLFWFSKSTGER